MKPEFHRYRWWRCTTRRDRELRCRRSEYVRGPDSAYTSWTAQEQTWVGRALPVSKLIHLVTNHHENEHLGYSRNCFRTKDRRKDRQWLKSNSIGTHFNKFYIKYCVLNEIQLQSNIWKTLFLTHFLWIQRLLLFFSKIWIYFHNWLKGFTQTFLWASSGNVLLTGSYNPRHN